MKNIIFIIILLFSSLELMANQEKSEHKQDQKRMEPLTIQQQEQIKAILANFKEATLTSKDAKKIHDEFRKIGLKGGHAMDDVIIEVGFSPEKLRELDPPPNENRKRKKNGKRKKILKNDLKQKNGFLVSSTGLELDGSLKIDYTGDGSGVSLPVEWNNAPKGTKYFALNLWHLPHPLDTSDVKSYWVLYNIPANVHSLPANVKDIGEFGFNDKDRKSYDPMKSKGPGIKEYNVTIYALSAKLEFSNTKVKRTDLLEAIKGITIGESTLTYTYERDNRLLKDK